MIIFIKDLLLAVDHETAAGTHHPADLRGFDVAEERTILDREQQSAFTAEVLIPSVFTHLIVALDGGLDVGFYSFDYCLVSLGKLNKDFSGNTAFGVSKIVDQIRNEIEKKNDGYKVNISVIERVLRKNEKQIMINEKFEDVQQYIDIASRKVADEALQPMINGLNTENDSIKVIFVGGGAKYFKNILAQNFHEEIPNFDPSKVKENTVTDNAVGFFYAGQ